MRRGVKIGIVGGMSAAMMGAAGYGAYHLYEGMTDGVTSAEATPVKTGPPTADEVKTTARDFLAAWAKDDRTAASTLTNDAATASAALDDYRSKARVSAVKLTPGTPAGAKVPFTVVATLKYDGKRSTWTYDSSLTVFRGRTTHKPLVDWQPSVLYPKLTPGQSLRTGRATAPQIDVVDRHGKLLDAAGYPSLGAILPQLRDRYAHQVRGGTPGIETWIDSVDGTAGETLHTISRGKPAILRTTLDATLQAAAEKAVKRRGQSSVAAVKASTGEILAFANHPVTGNNNAFSAAIAPGSTFKVITATALLEKGVTPGQSAPCPATVNYNQGKPFHNVESSADPSATFARDFAISCNTGFIKLAGKLDKSSVPTVARNLYGFGQTWNVGVPAWDGQVPGGSGDEMTEEMIGQGRIQMSPLNMASVAATAENGRFHQPRIVAKKLIAEPLAQSSSRLPYGVRANLKSMMRLTARSGTATTAMRGLYGDVGAKTGSAEVSGQEKPNGWFLAYRDDVAASGVVLEGGHGGDSAGPIVAAVLKAS